MNKARRHELKMLKYKKRLKKYGLIEKVDKDNTNFTAFRSHGKPCSCWMCSGPKFNRKMKHKENTDYSDTMGGDIIHNEVERG